MDSKYLRTILMSPKEFNLKQHQKRSQAKVSLEKLRFDYENKHHDLKTVRNFDFGLTQKEITILNENGIVVSKKCLKDFGNAYKCLYTNDIRY